MAESFARTRLSLSLSLSDHARCARIFNAHGEWIFNAHGEWIVNAHGAWIVNAHGAQTSMLVARRLPMLVLSDDHARPSTHD